MSDENPFSDLGLPQDFLSSSQRDTPDDGNAGSADLLDTSQPVETAPDATPNWMEASSAPSDFTGGPPSTENPFTEAEEPAFQKGDEAWTYNKSRGVHRVSITKVHQDLPDPPYYDIQRTDASESQTERLFTSEEEAAAAAAAVAAVQASESEQAAESEAPWLDSVNEDDPFASIDGGNPEASRDLLGGDNLNNISSSQEQEQPAQWLDPNPDNPFAAAEEQTASQPVVEEPADLLAAAPPVQAQDSRPSAPWLDPRNEEDPFAVIDGGNPETYTVDPFAMIDGGNSNSNISYSQQDQHLELEQQQPEAPWLSSDTGINPFPSGEPQSSAPTIASPTQAEEPWLSSDTGVNPFSTVNAEIPEPVTISQQPAEEASAAPWLSMSDTLGASAVVPPTEVSNPFEEELNANTPPTAVEEHNHPNVFTGDGISPLDVANPFETANVEIESPTALEEEEDYANQYPPGGGQSGPLYANDFGNTEPGQPTTSESLVGGDYPTSSAESYDNPFSSEREGARSVSPSVDDMTGWRAKPSPGFVEDEQNGAMDSNANPFLSQEHNNNTEYHDPLLPSRDSLEDEFYSGDDESVGWKSYPSSGADEQEKFSPRAGSATCNTPFRMSTATQSPYNQLPPELVESLQHSQNGEPIVMYEEGLNQQPAAPKRTSEASERPPSRFPPCWKILMACGCCLVFCSAIVALVFVILDQVNPRGEDSSPVVPLATPAPSVANAPAPSPTAPTTLTPTTAVPNAVTNSTASPSNTTALEPTPPPGLSWEETTDSPSVSSSFGTTFVPAPTVAVTFSPTVDSDTEMAPTLAPSVNNNDTEVETTRPTLRGTQAPTVVTATQQPTANTPATTDVPTSVASGTSETTLQPTAGVVSTDSTTPGPTVSTGESQTSPPTVTTDSLPETEAPTVAAAPTLAPSALETVTWSPTVNTALLEVLRSASPDQAGLNEAGSPQQRAHRWMENEDQVTATLSEAKQLQRYSLATFFFSTGGPEVWSAAPQKRQGGSSTSWLDPTTDDCEWEFVVCHSEGDIVALEMFLPNAPTLGGTLPPEIGLLSALEQLVIDAGDSEAAAISRKAAEELLDKEPTHRAMQEVETRQATSNLISGPLPSQIGNLQRLQTLMITNQALSGLLPSEAGQMASIVTLDLTNNQFAGPLPWELGYLSQVQQLRLGYNSFQVKIKKKMLNQPGGLAQSLQGLFLNNNQLRGALPAQLGLLTNLETGLFLNSNRFTGTLPVELMALTGLKAFRVDSTSLEGTVPVEFAQWNSIQEFRVQETALSGEMPAEMCQVFRVEETQSYATCEWLECPCCTYCCVRNGECVEN